MKVNEIIFLGSLKKKEINLIAWNIHLILWIYILPNVYFFAKHMSYIRPTEFLMAFFTLLFAAKLTEE